MKISCLGIVGLMLVACSFSLPSTLASLIVYDNGVGGAAGVIDGRLSDADFGFRQADDVMLNTTTRVSGIQWTGLYGNSNAFPIQDDFTINIYSDSGSSPFGIAPIVSFEVGDNVNRTDSGLNAGPLDIFDYTADIDFTMNAGETYWISIFNDTSSTEDFFFWSGSKNTGNGHQTFDAGVSWLNNNYQFDFRLTTIPEPAATIVLMFGLVGAARVRHSTRRNV